MDRQISTPRDRYNQLHKKADGIYHETWYGSPAKRPPSKQYRKKYDQINWNKKEQGNEKMPTMR